jgi:hypothetical protein
MGGFLQSNIVTQAVITGKAKSVVEDHKIKKEGADETFLVIKVWFKQFKSPSKCHSVKFSVEVASADAGAAAVYPAEFQVMMEDGNHSPDLIFKVDETGI